MAQTFDIRFARALGFAALFEAPANAFRWKGGGSLSIDESGIRIAVRRGLWTLFSRKQSRRIAASHLLEVYREGNALRLEFSTPESSRAVLPFWVDDRKAAAEIVTLLPTTHSVELEDDASSSRRYRFDRRLILLLAGAVALGVGLVTLQRYLADDRSAPAEPVVASVVEPAAAVRSAPTLHPVGMEKTAPIAGAPLNSMAGDPVPLYLEPPQLPASSLDDSPPIASAAVAYEDATLPDPTSASDAPNPIVRASLDGILPIVPGDPRYAIARREFDLFMAESKELRADYLYMRNHPGAGLMVPLEARWRRVTTRIYNTEDIAGIEFYALREMELAISRGWRDYLLIEASGNEPSTAIAFAFTDALEAHLTHYVL